MNIIPLTEAVFQHAKNVAKKRPEISPHELERESRRTDEFQKLAEELARSYGWKESPIRGVGAANTSDLLARVGLYHSAHAGKTFDSIRSRLAERLEQKNITRRTLLLLDNCHFPQESFQFLGRDVVRFSPSDIDRLGPPPELVEFQFRNERLDRDWHSNYWFLCKSREVAFPPDTMNFTLSIGDIVLESHWMPLLLLALYRLECFSVPIVVESDWEWRLSKLRSAPTEVDLWSPTFGPDDDESVEVIEQPFCLYSVSPGEQSSFKEFLRYFEHPMRVSDTWHPNSVPIAARRYLRATFMSSLTGDEPPWDSDSYEDILLHYVYTLESLLNFGKGGITEKVASRAAWLGGVDDLERDRIRSFVSDAYDERSGLAHGGSSSQEISILKLRDITRKVFAGYLALMPGFDNQKQLRRDLDRILVSQEVQSLVSAKRTETLALLHDD